MPFSGQELTEAVRADNLLPWILNLAGARIGGHFSINTQECIHTVTHTQWTGSPPLQMHLQDRCCNCCIVTGAHWDRNIERYEVSLSLEFKCKRSVRKFSPLFITHVTYFTFSCRTTQDVRSFESEPAFWRLGEKGWAVFCSLSLKWETSPNQGTSTLLLIWGRSSGFWSLRCFLFLPRPKVPQTPPAFSKFSR